MIRQITHADFLRRTAGDPYWRGRWPYSRVALDLVASLKPNTALEIGPWTCPLLIGSDTMDIRPGCTYRHDAGMVPWPIGDKAFDVVLALQVWEHLEGRQREAFGEVMRCARSAVMSFPLGWIVSPIDCHHGITEDIIREWTHGEIPLVSQYIERNTARTRTVQMWRFP